MVIEPGIFLVLVICIGEQICGQIVNVVTTFLLCRL